MSELELLQQIATEGSLLAMFGLVLGVWMVRKGLSWR